MFASLKLAVFVPATGMVATIVARGSAIIGLVGSDEHVTIDYEGALYGPTTMKTYADRARQAAGRQITNYPTVARTVVSRSQLRQVGWFDSNGITLLDDAEVKDALASWLGVEEIDPKELHFSGL